jgi:pyruvate-formate lyase-activating enzyme
MLRARVEDSRSGGFCIDPIEKKLLNHFLPGSAVLSFGTAGCNLARKLCQNWDMSKSRKMGMAYLFCQNCSPERCGVPTARVTTGTPKISII